MRLSNVRNRSSGFTMLELIFVLAVMALIAAVIIPNLVSVKSVGDLGAANQELLNVRTAEIGYLGAHAQWPSTSDNLTDFITGGTARLRASYVFRTSGQDAGLIINAVSLPAPKGWPDSIRFDPTIQKWESTSP